MAAPPRSRSSFTTRTTRCWTPLSTLRVHSPASSTRFRFPATLPAPPFSRYADPLLTLPCFPVYGCRLRDILTQLSAQIMFVYESSYATHSSPNANLAPFTMG